MIRRLLILVSLASYVLGSAAVVLHYLGVTSNTVARFASVAPCMILAAAAGVILALFTRRGWVIALGVLVVAAGVATQLPLYLGTTEPRGDDELTVLQANIYLGRADIGALARTVHENDVDVLTVSELTDDALTRIQGSSIVRDLPHAVTYPVKEGGGIGIFSRFPLENGTRLDGFKMANARAEAVIDGERFAVYALHPLPPWPQPAWRWELELRRLTGLLRDEPLPTIAGGDFNSTYDHVPLRRLIEESGTVDAAESTGAGVVATYPANRALVPAVLAIDRVLTGPGWTDRTPTAMSFERVELPGSDHHGVVARIRK
ncbi:MAG: endonuclease/exonuclease/phosphatase family protein [Gordonia sp. (in: high G+C Gram-positive bacteria)]|uniref:endonuclease/exonuclease/phosphatase family protein n=1 Tax=Gordonia sp. (in: high G+C Gram-positive bacteria) TaxID=84139 RepID=UPI0039E29122